jgi:hypothetical protein
MPAFIDLRADYPLILTLLAPAYPRALTWSYIARLASARTIAAPLFRHSQPVPVKTYTSFCSKFCSSACASSACESTWRLTPAHALLREFQPYADEKLMPVVEYQCANPRGSTEFDFRESAASLSAQSAKCALVEVTCCCALTNEIRRKDRTSVPRTLGGVPVHGQSGQVRSK